MKLTLDRWHHDNIPWRHAGTPVGVWQHETSGITVVTGRLHLWAGRAIADWSERDYRIAIYDRDGRLLHVLARRERDEVRAVAFHPSEPVVLIATGSYDGGSCYEGTLWWHNWATGESRTVLDQMADAVRFTSASEVELDLALDSDFDEVAPGGWLTRRRYSRDDWSDVPDGAIPLSDVSDERLQTGFPTYDKVQDLELEAARFMLRNSPYHPNGTTVGIAFKGDGTLDREVIDDRTGALVWPFRWRAPSETADGHTLGRRGAVFFDFDARVYRERGEPDLVYAPNGTVSHALQLGCYADDDYYCRVRGGRYLYACTGGSLAHLAVPWHLGKRVIRVDVKTAAVRALFPVEWLGAPRANPNKGTGGHPYYSLMGFLGVEIDDGSALVYATVEQEIGELAVASWLVRRDTTEGSVSWAVSLPRAYVTDICLVAERWVAIAVLDGRVLIHALEDGALVEQVELDPHWSPAVVGVAAMGDRLAVATAEGPVATYIVTVD